MWVVNLMPDPERPQESANGRTGSGTIFVGCLMLVTSKLRLDIPPKLNYSANTEVWATIMQQWPCSV
jgi:hypothetical protein